MKDKNKIKNKIKNKVKPEFINSNVWIKNKLISLNYDKKSVLGLFEIYKSETNSNGSLDSFRKRIGEIYQEILIENPEQKELIENLCQLSLNKQKMVDKNNFTNKLNRENYRLLNFVQESNDELIKLLINVDLNNFKLTEHKIKPDKQKSAIICLADLHAGQLVEKSYNLNNEYNLTVMTDRLNYYIDRCIDEFKLNGVTDVLILGCGDFVTSSRRLSEKLSLAASLIDSSFVVINVLRQNIIKLQKYFNVTFAGVVGNESRTYDDLMSSAQFLVNENYDYLIMRALKLLFEKSPVKFLDNNIREDIIQFGGKNIFLMHGDTIKSKKDIEDKVRDVISRYMTNNNIKIDYFICGHFHSCTISDFFTVSSSMMGADFYSGIDCLYMNRASQVYGYIVNNQIEMKRMDLQNI
jgi:predicted phosphodiesterase